MCRLYTYLLCFLFVSVQAQNPFTNVRDYIQRSEFKRPMALLDSCTEKNYQPDSVLFYKGLVQLKAGNNREAKKYCGLLMKTYPDFYDAHYLNGLILFLDRNYGKSVDEFSTAIKQNPKHIRAYYNRSVAFGVLEDYLSTIEDLSKCIELDPGYAQAYYSRGYWYEFTGNNVEAINDYESAIRLDPKNYDAYMGLAYVYRNLKEMNKACEIVTRAIGAGSQVAEDLKDTFCR